MTVPPLFGWEGIVSLLVLLLVVAVAFFVVGAAGTNRAGRSEWQALLEARTITRQDPAQPTGPAASADADGGNRVVIDEGPAQR
jgi:hypothetical protein